jgi:hypothetical protein
MIESLESRRLLATNGLTAVYYDNIDFTGKTFERTDPNVNMRVGTGSPVPGVIGPDQFSVRWTGTIEPQFSQTYTFYTLSNNGVRLWVNGRKVIDNWVGHATTEDRGTIALAAGRRYDLRVEFFDNTAEATATLSWSSPSVAKQIVPTARLHRYDVRFAALGDYGTDGPNEAAVAGLIKSWTPNFIITTGDNNYGVGAAETIDANIGKHYHDYIGNYKGEYGAGSPGGVNRFFPSLGNHDWYTAGAQPYFDYFTLPGNERYYDFARGPVHLFALDSDVNEPHGNTSTSRQAEWLQDRLGDSTAPWQLVYFHHAPYTSGPHGSAVEMQWDFKAWGADAVMTGHDHIYERSRQGGLPYFVNGLGGTSRYGLQTPIAGSEVRYNADYGAMLVQANDRNLTFQFVTKSGTLIDTWTLTAPARVTSSPPEVPPGPGVFAGPRVFAGGKAFVGPRVPAGPAVPARTVTARTAAGGTGPTPGSLKIPGPRAPEVCPCCPRTA